LFTYKITSAEANFLKEGMRVAVEFGKSKIFTALVYRIHTKAPKGYEAKEIHQILDEEPIVNEFQLKHWQWISDYYMCSMGEVCRAALPSAFLLESETEIELVPDFNENQQLSNDEFVIYEALQHQPKLSIQQIVHILGKKTIFPVVKTMIEKGVLVVKEQIYEQYKPKLVKYVQLMGSWSEPNQLEILLEKIARAKKQHALVLSYFQLKATKENIKVSELLKISNTAPSILKALVEKGVMEYYFVQKDRVNFERASSEIKELSVEQEQAFRSVKTLFTEKSVVLLKGITSSGKTEIYAKLIKQRLELNQQVLYLLPEIALTTQLIGRLQKYFGESLSVYHSKYSMNERVEVWNNTLKSAPKAQLILGARSALFLPFSNIGLIIIDEEHEPSFKQFNPAPRYHARDAAIVLANFHNTKVLMGSATPSLESYHNAKQGKYGLIELKKRYKNILLPEIELVDIKEKYHKKRMKGHFSDRLLELIKESLKNKEQVILFQNRRGYSPVIECQVCGISPQCPQCDVSLTHHHYRNELRCHYCGYSRSMPQNCEACGSEKLNSKGLGTEQVEMELNELFPDKKIGRMDFDTTRGKYSYQKIIGQFENQEIDILVGTQMLSKGLDFANVSLVGVMNADNMLNFPDFRAHERSYQLMVQVSGRAGRSFKRGKVAIQTFNPYHQILQQVSTNAFEEMYAEQLEDRRQYHYPPYYRLIKITLRHKDYNIVETGANWLGKSLGSIFNEHLLGPSTPSISKIRNYYIRTLIIKIPQEGALSAGKKKIIYVKKAFQAIKEFRAIRFNIDVDNY
jgi:primosomal protein N' (replication factor Y)